MSTRSLAGEKTGGNRDRLLQNEYANHGGRYTADISRPDIGNVAHRGDRYDRDEDIHRTRKRDRDRYRDRYSFLLIPCRADSHIDPQSSRDKRRRDVRDDNVSISSRQMSGGTRSSSRRDPMELPLERDAGARHSTRTQGRSGSSSRREIPPADGGNVRSGTRHSSRLQSRSGSTSRRDRSPYNSKRRHEGRY